MLFYSYNYRDNYKKANWHWNPKFFTQGAENIDEIGLDFNCKSPEIANEKSKNVEKSSKLN